MLVELDAAFLGLLEFVGVGDARRGGHVALFADERPEARAGAFRFELENRVGMVPFVFGNQPRPEFLADGVGAFDENFRGGGLAGRSRGWLI